MLPGQLISLRDGQVVLIEDGITEKRPSMLKPLLLEEATPRCARIWYAEDSLATARKLHPKAPAYGVWQTLIHNGLADPAKGDLYAYPLIEQRWAYVYSQDGVFTRSGTAIGDLIPALPGLTREDAIFIDIDAAGFWRGLRKPVAYGVLPSELQVAEKRERRIRLAIGGAACGLALLSAPVIDSILEARHQVLVSEHARLTQQLRAAQGAVGFERARRLPFSVDAIEREQRIFNRLVEVSQYANEISNQSISVHDASEISVEVGSILPGASFPWSLDVGRDATMTVTFSADAVDELAEPDERTRILEQQQAGGFRVR